MTAASTPAIYAIQFFNPGKKIRIAMYLHLVQSNLRLQTKQQPYHLQVTLPSSNPCSKIHLVIHFCYFTFTHTHAHTDT